MNSEWIRPVAIVVGAGALGTVVRLGLHALLGDEMVVLAAVNVVGWFILGLILGRYGMRVRQLWLFMVVFGLTAFTSWMTLLINGISVAGDIVVAFIEVIFGLVFAGIGHIITMPRGPDLAT